MGRRLMPDGRRTVVGVRLSDSQAARLDELRGDKKRADWCFEVIASALLAAQPGEPVRVRMAGRRARECAETAQWEREKREIPQAAFSDPPVNPLPAPEPGCDHPRARRDPKNKDLCRACGQVVGAGRG